MTHPTFALPVITDKHHAIHGFRCKECRGKAYADKGRVRVAHRQDCPIYLRLVLTHPRFYPTLESYRSNPN